MKTKQIKSFPAFIALMLLVLASCAKMPSSMDSVKVEVNPSPLEVFNGKVEATIKASFPEKYVPKKAVIEVTPYLVYEGGELAGEPFTVQGESVKSNNKSISYAGGGNISGKVSFPYKEELRKSTLILRAKVTMKKKVATLADYKIADGVIATSLLFDNKAGQTASATDKFVRITRDSKEAAIYFEKNMSNIRKGELTTAEVTAINDYIAKASKEPNVQLKNADVSAYASPDGTVELNTALAGKRQTVAQSYIADNLKKAKIETKSDFLKAMSTPEDWDGFKTLLQQSSIQDKDLILRVLSMYDDPAKREEEIKKLSSAFTEIEKTILPKLRRSKMTFNIEIVGKSDEEIAKLAAEKPFSLSLEEILYAGSLSKSDDQKVEIYKNASTFFPQDWRAFNNLGALYFKQGKLKEAEIEFAKANKIQATPQVSNNLGVVALANGSYDTAEQNFGKAAGVGQMLDYNMGVVSLTKGQYSVAKTKLGDCPCNNAALAKILTKDYSGAVKAIDNNKNPDALSFYLKAVANARLDKASDAIGSLKKAIEADSKWKAYAKKDIEFAKLAENSDFKALIN